MPAYELDGKRIVFTKTGAKMKFRHPVREVVRVGEVFVVRLEVPPRGSLNENVFGVNEAGEVLWQVPKVGHVYPNSPYTGIGRRGLGVLVCNWDGLDLVLDPRTGRILESREGR